MANKLDPLTNLTSTYGAVAALNANFSKIATALDNTVSRDGSSPNQMNADLDLNHHNILNIGNASDLKGAKGDPGVNGSTASNLTIGLFTGANGQSLAGNPEMVFTSGYSATGRGAAIYVKDAIVDAAFVTAHPTWSFRSSQGIGYRLSTEQKVYIEMFGAVGGSTISLAGPDNYNAWLAAKDFIHFYRVFPIGNPYYKPSVPLYFQATGYEFSNFLDFTDAAYELFGSGSPGSGGGGGTTLFFTDTCGLVLQSWDTAGVNTINQPNNAGTPHGASNSHFCDLMVYQRHGTVASAVQHGVLIKCGGVHFERVTAQNFGGDGFHIFGNVTGQGNANCNNFYFCGGHNNGLNGISVAAGDGNACIFIHFQANLNRKFGIAEQSFLGNHWLSYHTSGNGMPSSYGCGPTYGTSTTVPGARVTFGGRVYRVHPGADATAPATTPGTNSAIWVDIGAGAPSWVEAWNSGHNYSSGGGVYIGGNGFIPNNNNRSFMTGYCELDQPDGWGDSSLSVCINGNGGAGPTISAWNTYITGTPGIGSRTSKTDGTTLVAINGGDANNDGQFFGLGFSDAINWTRHLRSDNTIAWKWLGADSSIPMVLVPGTTVPGISFPRGASFTVSTLINAANDAAAATAGVGIGQVYRNGSILMVRVA